MKYRLVHGCREGFYARFNPCKGSMKQVIAIRPVYKLAEGTTAAAKANPPSKVCILSISMRCIGRLSVEGGPRKCCGGGIAKSKAEEGYELVRS